MRHYDRFGRGTGYSIGGVRKTTLAYDAASGRLVGMAAGSDNFAWEYLAGTNLKSKLTHPNAADVSPAVSVNALPSPVPSSKTRRF